MPASFVLVYYHNRISNFQSHGYPCNNLFGLGRLFMKYAAQFRHLAFYRLTVDIIYAYIVKQRDEGGCSSVVLEWVESDRMVASSNPGIS